ncbi:MAG: FAD-dependent oxidoreductase [Dethiosulfatibacter sp.]|nr:FAD-dependent oxidoreductase [Dethiosulfatibacter sp.]
MKYDYHIIVIGAGSAGLVTASGIATIGAKVALIESDKMGGDCLNTGCVPSKTFLKSAHIASAMNDGSQYGIDSGPINVDWQAVKTRIQSIIKEIEPHDSKERFEKMGVDVFLGKAYLLDNHTVLIGEEKITGRNIVLATGSDPLIPSIPGLQSVPYKTNLDIFDLPELPKKLLILGSGSIALELGQGFSHLGVDVTIISRSSRLFQRDEPEVHDTMLNTLSRAGMKIHLNAAIMQVVSIDNDVKVQFEERGIPIEVTGDTLLVALGRKPATASLGLENTKVQCDKKGFIITDQNLRTHESNIYACGDVVGPYLFTHMAGYQAGIVIRNVLFRLGSKVDYKKVTWCTYTKPEVAHVGLTEAQARDQGLYKESLYFPLNKNDRARTDNDRIGFLKLVVNKKGLLIGATIVSEKAGDLIPLATLAIQKGLKPSSFLGIIYPYPIIAESYSSAALEKTKSSLKEWHKKLIHFVFLR